MSIGAVRLEFGALAPPIKTQLRRQGLLARNECASLELEALEEHCTMIVRLLIAGLLTDGEVHRARKRVMRRVRGLVRAREEVAA